MNILNVGYDSTNYYLLDSKDGKLLVDCDWPGTLPKSLSVLKRKDVSPDEIKYLLVTHFHPDHSGLTQELKNLGVSLILLESQVGFTDAMDELYKSKNLPYSPLLPKKLPNSSLPIAGTSLQLWAWQVRSSTPLIKVMIA